MFQALTGRAVELPVTGRLARPPRRRRSAPSVSTDHGRDDRAHPHADGRAGAEQRGAAVDLGRLVRGAPLGGAGHASSSSTSTSTSSPTPVLGALRRPARRPGRSTRSTRVATTSSSSLPSSVGGLGAVLVGVAEDADRVQPGRGEEPLQLGDVVLGLAREPDDDVGPDARLGRRRPDLLDQLEEALGVAEPAHPAQHRAAGVLEGQVEVGRHARRRRSSPRPGPAASRRAAGS